MMIIKKHILYCAQFTILLSSYIIGQQIEEPKESKTEKIAYSLSQFKKFTSQATKLSNNEFAIIFDQPQGMYIVNFDFDGQTIGRLEQTHNTIEFQSISHAPNNFKLTSPIETGLFKLTTPNNKITFANQVQAKSANVESKGIDFLSKFLTLKDLALKAEYADIFDELECRNICVKGKYLNLMPGGKLTVNGSAYLLPKEKFYNGGEFDCRGDLMLSANAIENWQKLNANNFYFETKDLLNKGSIELTSSLNGVFDQLINDGNFQCNADCIFPKVGKFFTRENSKWSVGKNWTACMTELYLVGNTLVGGLAILNASSDVYLVGTFRSTIVQITSGGLLKCDFTAQLLATHHIGLKAKGWIETDSDIFKIDEQAIKNISSNKVDQSSKQQIPQGVFFHSEEGGIKKAGRVISQRGTVSFNAKNDLIHTDQTRAGFEQGDKLLMQANTVNIEKDSNIHALDADLAAEKSVHYNGNVNVEELLTTKAPEVIQSNVAKSKNFAALANNVTFKAGSHTNFDNGQLLVEENLNIDGSLEAKNNLRAEAQNLAFGKDSNARIKTGQLKVTQEILNNGELNVEELSSRSKYFKNNKNISIKNGTINADRWLWSNPFSRLKAEDSLTINSLATFNFLGYNSGKNFTLNSGLNFNLFGLSYAKNFNTNSLINLNFGLQLPRIQSFNDFYNSDISKVALASLILKKNPLAYGSFVLGKTLIDTLFNRETTYNLQDNIERIASLAKSAKNLSADEDSGVSDCISLLVEAKNQVSSYINQARYARTCYSTAMNNFYPVTPNSQEPVQDNNSKQLVDDNVDQPKESLNTTQPTQDSAEQASKNNSREQLLDRTYLDKLYDLNTLQKSAIDFGKSSLPILFPQTSTDTLIGLNFGATLGFNGNLRSIYCLNNGLSAHGNNNINTLYGNNNGLMAAADLYISANTYNHNGRFDVFDGSFTADNWNNDGKTNALNIIKIDCKALNLGENSDTNSKIYIVKSETVKGDGNNKIRTTQFSAISTAHLDNQGSVEGKHIVDFTGAHENLIHIGQVEDLQYRGTLENGLADTLANGNNDLLHVEPNGSVTIVQDQDDINFKSEHDIPHSLYATTDNNINIEKQITSKGDLGFHANKAVNHNSLKASGDLNVFGKESVEAQADVERTSQGDSYEDKYDPIILESGGKTNIGSKGPVIHKGVKSHSGEGTTTNSGGNTLCLPVVTEKHSETHTKKNNKSKKKDKKETYVYTHGCEYTSDGKVQMVSNDTVELFGTTFNAKEGTNVHGENSVNGHPTYNSHSQELFTKKRGRWLSSSKNKNKRSERAVAKAVSFKGEVPPVITSNKKIQLPFTCEAPKIIINAPEVKNEQAKDIHNSSKDSKKSNIIWQSEKHKKKEIFTHQKLFTGEIESNANNFINETKSLKNNPKITLTNPDGTITHNLVYDHHDKESVILRGPTREASIVIAMAVTLATSGFASSFGAGLAGVFGGSSTIATSVISQATSTAITSLSVQASDALLRTGGDLGAAAKLLCKNETLKNILISAITSGAITASGSWLSDIGLPTLIESNSLTERILFTMPRQAATAGIRTIVDLADGENFNDSFYKNMKFALVDTIGIAGANQIGKLYAQGLIDPVTHKLLHTALGAVEGAILNGKDGILGGALGALVAEITAEKLAPEKPSLDDIKEIEVKLGRELTQDEFCATWNNLTDRYMQKNISLAEISKLAGVVGVLLSKQDVATAKLTSTTAIDNNFLPAVTLGITLAYTAYTSYEIYKAYETDGVEGALKQLGIEIIFTAAGGALVKGTALTFKYGKQVYPSAKAACEAVFSKNPALKLALGDLTNKICKYGEKNTAKLINNATKIATEVEEQIIKNKNKFLSKFSKDIKPPSHIAQLKDGYYEVNGFKFTQYYYEKLWSTGRGAPSLSAKAILENAKLVTPDIKKPGFMKYIAEGWEMVYNPTTKEVWHIQPIKKK